MAYNWFLTTAKYEKTAEEGKIVVVSEQYLVDALTFKEAEERTMEEVKPFVSGELIISAARRARINEMFYNENGDKWYKCKVLFVSLDEEKGIEKKTASIMMAQACDITEALAVLTLGMKGTMADYEIFSITETLILDVFPYKAPCKE